MRYDTQGFVTADDGTRLFYGTRGTGSAIVLNDGIGCDGFAWKYLQPHFAAKHRVVHWHYRGHGRSGLPVDTARIDIPAHTRDMLAVLDHLEIPQAVLFGHSMGTQVALEMLRLAPSRVRALVLICGSYGLVTSHFHGTDTLKQVLPRLIETVQRYQGVARGVWGRVPSGLAYRIAKLGGEIDALAIREEDFRAYWDHIALMDPNLFLAMLRLAGEHSAEDLLGRIEVPTLVIAAERDTFTPPELARHMAEMIPGAEIMMIRGGSHASPVEQPMAMQLRIEKFFEERLGEAP